jgi:hypothetical protein
VNVDLNIEKIPRYKHHLNHTSMWDFQRDPLFFPFCSLYLKVYAYNAALKYCIKCYTIK